LNNFIQVPVRWGASFGGLNVSPNYPYEPQLSDAEACAAELSDDARVATTNPGGASWQARIAWPFNLVDVKTNVLVRGLSDCTFYCSPEGEQAVRDKVFGTLGSTIETQVPLLQPGDEIRLHIICHSLGVTVGRGW
jgi:hypothetical protein